MTRSAETGSRPLTCAATALVALLSCGSFVAAAGAEDFRSGIYLWTPDGLLGQGRGLHYIAPPPAAYVTPFTGTPSKYPPPVFYGPSVGVTLDGTGAP
jgi:hypothetical protein